MKSRREGTDLAADSPHSPLLRHPPLPLLRTLLSFSAAHPWVGRSALFWNSVLESSLFLHPEAISSLPVFMTHVLVQAAVTKVSCTGQLEQQTSISYRSGGRLSKGGVQHRRVLMRARPGWGAALLSLCSRTVESRQRARFFL